jgi:hypothetical protein
MKKRKKVASADDELVNKRRLKRKLELPYVAHQIRTRLHIDNFQVTALKFGYPASGFLATASLDRTVKVYQ